MRRASGSFIKNSFAAGVAISLGGVAYLSSGNALMFPIGLLIVCLYRLYLFTGKVGYLGRYGVNERKFDVFDLFLMWIFNTLGAYISGFVVGVVKPELVEVAGRIRDKKMSGGLLTVFVLGILCNIMIFLAVDSYRTIATANRMVFAGIFSLFVFTATFVYCGFEHCVANAFYFGLSGFTGLNDAIRQIIFLVINMLGNAAGGIITERVLKENAWRN